MRIVTKIAEKIEVPRRSLYVYTALSALVIFVTACLGCGGGTTGTSPSDTFKFSGFAEQSDGRRAGSLTMTVRSGATNDPLLDSGTDSQGQFSMDLPAEEQSLNIDVTGVGSTTIARTQRGDGAVTAKLKVTPQGSLQAIQLYEAQVIPDSLCNSITSSGTSLVVTGPIGQEPCPVTIAVTSQEVAVTSFTGLLRATCDGQPETIATSSASVVGELQFDLREAFSRGCTKLSITITTPRAPELQTVFVVF